MCAPRAFPSTSSFSEPGHRCRAASKRENSPTEDLDITQIDNNKKTLATHLSINKLSTKDKLMYEGGDKSDPPIAMIVQTWNQAGWELLHSLVSMTIIPHCM